MSMQDSRHVHGGNIYRYPEGILDFSANINPLGMPSSVEKAAMEAAAACIHYPEPGSSSLCSRIAAWESREMAGSGCGLIAASQLVCGNGAAELIFTLCRALQPASGICLAPSFAEYAQALSAAGSRTGQIYLREEDGFALTGQAVREQISSVDSGQGPAAGSRLLFLCIPNNPTGLVPDEDVFDHLLKYCRDQGIWLILDACFADLCGERERKACRHMTARTLAYEKGIVLKAFTKSFAMPGLRLGYLMARNEEFLDCLRRQLQPWNVSRVAQMAGEAAVRELEEGTFLSQSLAYIEKEKSYLLEGLHALSGEDGSLVQRIYGHAANYIFFRALGERGRELGRLLAERGVLIRDCSNFPGLEKGYYRIAVRRHEENRRLLEEMTWLSGL